MPRPQVHTHHITKHCTQVEHSDCRDSTKSRGLGSLFGVMLSLFRTHTCQNPSDTSRHTFLHDVLERPGQQKQPQHQVTTLYPAGLCIKRAPPGAVTAGGALAFNGWTGRAPRNAPPWSIGKSLHESPRDQSASHRQWELGKPRYCKV